jgi:prophage antirepressor-like protein
MVNGMNELQVFENSEFGKVRTLIINEEPWFVGKDVADILGYSNSRDALVKHVDNEDKGVAKCDTLGGTQELTVINESGLYSMILSSKLPTAKRFKHWVTSEVLPALRKTGRYEIKKQYHPTRPLTTDDYEEAAKTIAKCHNSRLLIVIDLYKKAGFDIETMSESELKLQPQRNDADKAKLVELLNRYSLTELCNKLPICKSSIYYYRIGKCFPHTERLEEIIRILEG